MTSKFFLKLSYSRWILSHLCFKVEKKKKRKKREKINKREWWTKEWGNWRKKEKKERNGITFNFLGCLFRDGFFRWSRFNFFLFLNMYFKNNNSSKWLFVFNFFLYIYLLNWTKINLYLEYTMCPFFTRRPFYLGSQQLTSFHFIVLLNSVH